MGAERGASIQMRAFGPTASWYFSDSPSAVSTGAGGTASNLRDSAEPQMTDIPPFRGPKPPACMHYAC